MSDDNQYQIKLVQETSDAHLGSYLMAKGALLALGRKDIIDQIESMYSPAENENRDGAPESDKVFYIIGLNDTLSEILKTYNLTPEEYIRLNPHMFNSQSKDGLRFIAGTTIRVK